MAVTATATATTEESMAEELVAVKESSVAMVTATAAMVVAVEGGCDCYLLYRIYYFIVMFILFYCVKS